MLSFLLTRKVSERRLYLFGCACCRRLPHSLDDDDCWNLVQVVERFADNRAGEAELTKAYLAVDGDMPTPDGRRTAVRTAMAGLPNFVLNSGTGWQLLPVDPQHSSQWAAMAVATEGTTDLDMNDPRWLSNATYTTERAVQARLLRCVFGNPHRPLPLSPLLLTDSVTKLASAIYHERAWDRMGVLADALEENGLADEAVLAHCRKDTLHSRGCHVVDAILGKE